ncbi:MAG: tRNA glutamyl-Q(34) synthetase GluQRS [Propionibacteriaceae bacterium]|jgi:glutamyl-tRNA synthetase|nr:tRNA glutamyl-Q(34) synthetase GluQRS [Propionibacteriaceae bacterium]
MFGRFAPTPSGELHVGNLRTGLVAWLAARASGRGFLIRVEDIDQPRLPHAEAVAARQLDDLARLGLNHDGPIVWQSRRAAIYDQAMAKLRPHLYECFCSRKDIAEATRAPHGSTAIYPGTCRGLSEPEKAERRARRQPSWRIDARSAHMTITDAIHGSRTAPVDDFVVRRADGVWAYNFVVVVDDADQGVDQIVRGDDLLESAPRQAWLAKTLGYPPPTYLHVPLVLAPDGTRLAKRDGAIGLNELLAAGLTVGQILGRLGHSLGLAAPGESVTAATLAARFDPGALPRQPWLTDPVCWAGR